MENIRKYANICNGCPFTEVKVKQNMLRHLLKNAFKTRRVTRCDFLKRTSISCI